MIEISEVVEGILAGYSYQMHFRLQSWLAGDVIAEDIPALDVVEEQDATLRVPERLSFRVPLEVDGVSWVPSSFDSPLGCYGQRILAQVGVSVAYGEIEWLNRGIYLLESAQTDGSSVSVECLGLLQMLDEAELATEFQPTTGMTLGTTLRQLIEPGITVDLDEAPTDRAVPKSAVTWSDNRLDDVFTILDAWPAQGRITNEGHYEITAVPGDPVADDVVFEFTDGVGGTVVEYAADITRDGAFNAVIAQGQYDDDRGSLSGLPIVHTWYDADPESPYSLFGNFSPYFVPYKFDSPLLNEHTRVLLAAQKKLVELRRKASRTVKVTAVPHPALQLDDVVSITSRRLNMGSALGRVDAFSLPYSAEGGAMELTIRLHGLTSPPYVEPLPPEPPTSTPPPSPPPSTPGSHGFDQYFGTYGDTY